ncbi:Hypothetical protein mma_0983 [Janthinobacterium sp. Marseille]|uniref:Uncharacterized protein n=1 Tax=Herminiimonas aquatilis TaxID=345342 RepID=A0ABW2JA91_9BURK|nr:hypothetical protein [Janthinobacterium sp. Marseille]ABR91939.1 Hypothetical protein mma_0983 [Janthinobacterium sp. Marseille]
MSSNPATKAHKLKIDLQYYDAKHQSLLAEGTYRTLGTAAKVKSFKTTSEIFLADFLNYFLIHRANNPSYATYKARRKYLKQASDWIDGVLNINDTINCLQGSEGLQEKVGEAVSLSVASVMFGLTAADWTTIPEQRGLTAHPTFDFERILVGITNKNEVIQIEAKGSFVKDNNVNQEAVVAQARKIEKKKIKIAKAGAYKHPAFARYGMIASIDPSNTAKCLLLDPPSDQVPGNPSDIKIASRLEYVASIVSLLAPKASLADALETRAALWRQGKASDEPETLRSKTGHAYTARNYVEDFFANGKVWMEDRDIVGQVYCNKSGRAFFLGLHGDVIRTAIQQDPKVIIQAHYEPSSKQLEILARPVHLDQDIKDAPRYMSMIFHTASSGVVLGFPSDSYSGLG